MPPINGKLTIAVFGIYTTILVAAFLFTGKTINQHQSTSLERHERIISKLISVENRLTAIESNRFTSNDGLRLLQNLDTKFPPQWLKDDVKDLNSRIKDLENNNHRH